MKEEPDVARRALVDDPDAAKEGVTAEVDAVVEVHADLQLTMAQRHVGHQRVVEVDDFPRPARVVEPGEATIDPDADAARAAAGVILLAHPGVIDVAQVVVVVEIDQQGSIADGKVA